ncbi:hypothetical protein WA026_023721 [Henosepilachna vigintioctopunctata]|uniref:Uncharacterized protein n=1 Tax=Henosepilachna vigintioctopunctata TaxID=420089 RepID=A0AAW1VHC6_9CUCU
MFNTNPILQDARVDVGNVAESTIISQQPSGTPRPTYSTGVNGLAREMTGLICMYAMKPPRGETTDTGRLVNACGAIRNPSRSPPTTRPLFRTLIRTQIYSKKLKTKEIQKRNRRFGRDKNIQRFADCVPKK